MHGGKGDGNMSYDEFFSSPLGKEILEREASFMAGHLYGISVSIGCGTGIIEKRVMEIKNVEIIGVERDEEMVRVAKGRINIIKGDASHLPFIDDSLDGIAFITSLEFIKDYKKALEEAKRVLKKDGRMVAIVLNTSSSYFQEMYEKGGYVKKHIKNMDVDKIEEYMRNLFHVKRKGLFEIRDGEIIDGGNSVYSYIATIR